MRHADPVIAHPSPAEGERCPGPVPDVCLGGILRLSALRLSFAARQSDFLCPQHEEVSIKATSGRLALNDILGVTLGIHDGSRELGVGFFWGGFFFLSSAVRHTKYIIPQILRTAATLRYSALRILL